MSPRVAIALVAAYGVFIAVFSSAGFPPSLADGRAMPWLAAKPLAHDGYYVLGAAWNLAETGSFESRPGVPAAGVQPLAALADAGLARCVQAAGGDRWQIARAAIVFQTALLAAFALIAGRIAARMASAEHRRRAAAAAAAVAAAANFTMFRLFATGLDTGLYLVLFAACVLYSMDRLPSGRAGAAGAVRMGLLAGAAGLARIDFGAMLAAWLVIMAARRRIGLTHALIIGVAALAAVAPWLAWVHARTGHWAPPSAAARAELVSAAEVLPRARDMAIALMDHLAPWAFTGGRASGALLALASAVAVLWWTRPATGPTALKDARDSDARASFTAWAAAAACLALLYSAASAATFSYVRYAAPCSVLIIPWWAARVAAADTEVRARRRAAAWSMSLAACFAAWAVASMHTGRVGGLYAVEAGVIAREDRLSATRVGVFKNGVAAYFFDNVVNIDPAVDSHVDLSARGGLGPYLDAEGVGALVGSGEDIHAALRPEDMDRWRPTEIIGHRGPEGIADIEVWEWK
jgi:hypothetical protein